MFDAGFQEFFLIFVIGLVVLGPKRLPRVVHAAGIWLGRARGAMTKLQREINREMMIEDRAEAVAQRRAAAEKESAAASPGEE
ncbi:MAG: Sec-independent protein translocase protein TatB [Gammaproteobacteria bacterium]|nr:Sec-independent protein translocase protein TatB [Gammaproteobacteria bacterium]NNF62266.1 twin-arginine translocase subunit TatB [Gammaproteobacteria bacterium]NNM21063.1 twin-arginine translocase subunit TatB [Gammaproteobacteria bacterium]